MPSFTQELSEFQSQLHCIYDYIEHWSGEEGTLTSILFIVQKRMKRLAEIIGSSILQLGRAQRSNPSIYRLEEICRDSLTSSTTGYQDKLDCEILQDMQSQLELIQNTQDIFNDKKCRQKIIGIVQETKERLVVLVGNSLHELHSFRPKLNVLKRMINTIPRSLFVPCQETNLLPIQTAAMHNSSLKYIPVLAKVGQIHDVGGKNKRGGLVTNFPDNWDVELKMLGITNTLKFLAYTCHADKKEDVNEEDMRHLKALKTLHEENLLSKRDVFQFCLLYVSSWEQSKLRFKFFLQLDPDVVDRYSSLSLPFMNEAIRRSTVTMRAILESTFECYPDQAGFLFQNDYKGTTAFETALTTYGENNTMSAIRDIISAMNFPILHHALIATPKFTSIFANWFPWAYHIRDHNGRSLIQAILAAGGKCVNENSFVFASLSHVQIQERDPVTTLYPFAAVVSGKEGDLQKSFYLLRRQPGVLNGMIPKNNTSKKRGKKRKNGKAE